MEIKFKNTGIKTETEGKVIYYILLNDIVISVFMLNQIWVEAFDLALDIHGLLYKERK